MAASCRELILGALRQVLGRNGPLAGRKIVVTAGGTASRSIPSAFSATAPAARWDIAWPKPRSTRAVVTLVSAPPCSSRRMAPIPRRGNGG